jgi:hypothetical protein
MPYDVQTGEWWYPVLREIWRANGATRTALLAEVEGLQDAQLAFQLAPGRWSIGEILDHLCLSERSLTRTISKILQQAAGLGQIGEPGAMPDPVVTIDRARYDQPAGAPESVLPSPDRPLERLLAGLAESRERLLEVTRRVDGRVVGPVTLHHFQLGDLAFYQWLAVAGVHEAKHLAQIRAIKAQPGFPAA